MSTALPALPAVPTVTKLKGIQRVTLLLIGATIGCVTSPNGPSELSSAYALATVDGQQLPAPAHDLPDGAVVLSAVLDFSLGTRPRGSEPGLVSYTREIRLSDQSEDTSTMELLYTVNDGELRINLCPPTAECLVPTELVGPADREELVLTHYLANLPQSTYHFVTTFSPE